MSKGSKCPINISSIVALALAVTAYIALAIDYFNGYIIRYSFVFLLIATFASIGATVLGFISLRSAKHAERKKVSIIFSILAVVMGIAFLGLLCWVCIKAINLVFEPPQFPDFE